MIDELELSAIVSEVFSKHPKSVEDAIAEEVSVHHLAGLVVKETKGDVDPTMVYRLVRRGLYTEAKNQ